MLFMYIYGQRSMHDGRRRVAMGCVAMGCVAMGGVCVEHVWGGVQLQHSDEIIFNGN